MMNEKAIRCLYEEALHIKKQRANEITVDVIDVKIEYEMALLERILMIKKNIKFGGGK